MSKVLPDPDSIPTPAAGGGRVLVVDDDADLGAIIMATLRREGLQVRQVLDGRAGISTTLQWAPDIVLLDLELPGVSGFDVCRAIRTAGGVSPLVVMVTGRRDLDSKLEGLSAGADDYLVKPLDPRELQARVVRWLAMRSAQADVVREQRARALREMVVAISHTVNNALMAAMGAVDLMGSEEMPPPVRAHLHTVDHSLQQIADVVRRLRSVEDKVVPYVGEETMIDLGPPGAN